MTLLPQFIIILNVPILDMYFILFHNLNIFQIIKVFKE